MATHYLKMAEVLERLAVDAQYVHTLEAEGLIHPKRTLEEEIVLSSEDADRIRVVRILTEELDVNLCGVEVILHMREEMVAMQRQFDEILAAVVSELRERLKR
ncbi:MAG: MerR family transcriptional regulator [Deltaproteobacteria bacterium]|nr:MerR family transcriptional regulator [Deltaproteobacteria bacterium]